MVHVETQRPPRHHRQQDVSDDGDIGPSTTQIERDEEYARRLQVYTIYADMFEGDKNCKFCCKLVEYKLLILKKKQWLNIQLNY